MTPRPSRRDFFALSATAALSAALPSQGQAPAAAPPVAPAAPTGPFTLAPLPYEKTALLPHIDALGNTVVFTASFDDCESHMPEPGLK